MISNSSENLPQSLTAEQEKQQFEQSRMHDVELLIDNLFRREEETLKLVINHLYDVGSANLINQKIPLPALNGAVKYIAKLSKPAFRCLAIYWVKRNCPELVANWLHRKVSFQSYIPPEETIVEVADQAHDAVQNEVLSESTGVSNEVIQDTLAGRSLDAANLILAPSTLASLTAQRLEIQALRTQVRLFAGTAIAAIAVLGGTITYISYRLEISPLQLLQLPHATTVDRSTNCLTPRRSAQSADPVTQETSTSPTRQ